MSAERACPRSALRGCPRGERIELYSSTADAPCRHNDQYSSHIWEFPSWLTKDAISAGGECHWILCVLLKTAATTAKPQKAPTNDQNAPHTFPTSCLFSFLYPRSLDTGVGNLCRGEGGMMRLRKAKAEISKSTYQTYLHNTATVDSTRKTGPRIYI